MHDIDRTQAETWETYDAGPTQFGFEMNPGFSADYSAEPEAEYYGEAEAEYYGEAETEYAGGGPMDEALELELTAQLLDVSNEAELDQFLGDLIRKVGHGISSVVRGPLGNVLKSVGRKYLPAIGGALGSMIAPGVGTAAGASLASAAGKALGLELEGLSPEDREFEVARNYVRLASSAVQHAATAPPTIPPNAVAQQAVQLAAQQHAPGLAATLSQAMARPSTNGQAKPSIMAGEPYGASSHPGRRTGRWIRRGSNVLLIGTHG